MRLSTSWMYQQSLASMTNQQSALAATQNQVSTGKRINVASDDPAGAGRVVSLNHILAANTQYTANIDAALQANPVAEVKIDHQVTISANARRGPMRSPSQPPGT